VILFVSHLKNSFGIDAEFKMIDILNAINGIIIFPFYLFVRRRYPPKNRKYLKRDCSREQKASYFHAIQASTTGAWMPGGYDSVIFEWITSFLLYLVYYILALPLLIIKIIYVKARCFR